MKAKQDKLGTLIIGYTTVDVFLIPTSLAEVGEMRGCYDAARHEIQISDSNEDEHLRAVLWHEILHAFFDVYGWSKEITEEEVAEHLPPALVAFIACNQAFVQKYLL